VRLGSNPGLALRIRKKGFDRFFESVANLSSVYIQKLPIPEASATVSGIDVNIKNVRITSFPPPRIAYKLAHPNKIDGSLKLPAVGLEANFDTKRRLLTATQTDAGGLVFNVTDASVSFHAVLSQFDNGIPKIDTFDCDAKLGPANLKVKGNKEQYSTDVLSLAAKTIRPVFNSQVCAVVKKLVATQLNRFLGTIKTVVDINPKVSIKFKLDTAIEKDYVQINLYGKVITDSVSPHVPAPFVEAANKDTMVVLFVSDALINDILYQAYANHVFDFTINENSPAALYDLIRLKCSANQPNCLGADIPLVAQKYGEDASVEVRCKATKVPEVVFSDGKASFSASGSFDVFVTTKNDSKQYNEGASNVDFTGTATVNTDNGELEAKVSLDKLNVQITKDEYKQYEAKIIATVKRVVEERVNNGILKDELDLRKLGVIGLENPQVTFLQHTLQIQTGFAYKPQVSAEKKRKLN